jgi:hypothetical protein
MDEKRVEKVLAKLSDEALDDVAGGYIVYIEEDDRWLIFDDHGGWSMVADFKTKEEAINYINKSNKYKGTKISTYEMSRDQFNRSMGF